MTAGRLPVCGQYRQHFRNVVLGQDDQNEVIGVISVELLDGFDARRCLFSRDDILELDPVVTDVAKTLPPCQDGDVLPGLLYQCCIETAHVAGAIDQDFHASVPRHREHTIRDNMLRVVGGRCNRAPLPAEKIVGSGLLAI